MNTAFGKCVLIIVMLITFATSCTAATLYVKPESSPARATHSGASWNTAFASVSDALAHAANGSEVWVAQGSYKSDKLDVPIGVKLYGGFAGNETIRDQRDSAAHETTLLVKGLYMTNDSKGLCIVDGFTVDTNGNTGIYLISSSSVVSNNSIKNCAYGVLCMGGAPVVTGNRLSGDTYGIICSGATAKVRNNAVSGCRSAGIECRDGDTSTVANNTMVGTDTGIGVNVRGGSPTIANNIVAFWPQTGIRAIAPAKPTVSHNCTFGNAMNYGGITPDPGSIFDDPQFVNRASANYELVLGSPCTDTGDDRYVVRGELDIDGQPRVCGLHVDIGADESWIVLPGASAPTVVDDGANQMSADSLHAIWAGGGSGNPVVEYDYAVGTSPTYDDTVPLIVGWTSVGGRTGVTLMNLRLRDDPGLRYYFYVKGKDAGGAWSPVGVSGGVSVANLQDRDFLLGIGDFEESHLVPWFSSVPNPDLVTLSPSPSIYADPSGQDGYLLPGNENKELGDGWRMAVAGTPTPYANTLYRIDKTNRFGTGNCQYVALQGQLGGWASAQAVHSLVLDATKPYALHVGDTVTFTIDHVQMSDYDGSGVEYRISLGPRSSDAILTPSTNGYRCSTGPYTIPAGTDRLDVLVRIDANGSLNGHTPGIYIDGAHLTVQRSGEPGNERWAIPVRPVRNVKTNTALFNEGWTSDYAAARDYDSISFSIDGEANAFLRSLNPNLKVYFYQSGTNCLDRRDSQGNDQVGKQAPVTFLEALRWYPDWLYSDGNGGYIRGTEYLDRYELHITNPAYQALWASGVVDKARSGREYGPIVATGLDYDGVWIDNLSGLTPAVNGIARLPWEVQQFMHAGYEPVKAAGLKIIQNVAAMHLDGSVDWAGNNGRVYCDPFWQPDADYPEPLYRANTPNTVADVLFQEWGFFKPRSNLNEADRSYWLACLNDMDIVASWDTAVDGNNKPKLGADKKRELTMWTTGANFSINGVDDVHPLNGTWGLNGWISYGLCSYLLGQNEWTSVGFRVAPAISGNPIEYPNVDYSVTKLLGVVDGTRTQFSQNDPYWVYRNYKSSAPGEVGGVVVVNGDTAAARSYTVPFDADMAELHDGETLFTFVPANTVIQVPGSTGRLLLHRSVK